MAEIHSPFDELRCLLGAQDNRQPARCFWQRQVIALVGPSEDLQIQEAECTHLHHDRVRRQFLLFE